MRTPLWFPYAQMKTLPPPLRVVHAEGTCLHLDDGRTLIDAIASWWCMIHGYNHPALNAALTEQAGHFAHVMLGGLVHAPAERLAETLVRISPPGLAHVFFGDSGSVAMEVAMKMAIQVWRNRGMPKKHRFLALRRAYHGDTCGVMSISDPDDGMHRLFAGLLPTQLFVDPPAPLAATTPETLAADTARLESMLKTHADELAAFVVEPILQGAGGIHFYDPAYLHMARTLCDRYGVLLVFDEIATGFGRTGTLFAAEQAQVTPDIMAVGKGLTAGYLGHGATLCTEAVFDAFYTDNPEDALMHGPTFMGNPLACAVALESIRLFFEEGCLARIGRIEAQLRAELLPLRHASIRDVRVKGAAGCVEVGEAKVLEGVQTFAAERGVWLRPFSTPGGAYLYTMPPYCITEEELARVIEVIRAWFVR